MPSKRNVRLWDSISQKRSLWQQWNAITALNCTARGVWFQRECYSGRCQTAFPDIVLQCMLPLGERVNWAHRANAMLARLEARCKKSNKQTIVQAQAVAHFLSSHKITAIRRLAGKLGTKAMEAFEEDKISDLLHIPAELFRINSRSYVWEKVVRIHMWNIQQRGHASHSVAICNRMYFCKLFPKDRLCSHLTSSMACCTRSARTRWLSSFRDRGKTSGSAYLCNHSRMLEHRLSRDQTSQGFKSKRGHTADATGPEFNLGLLHRYSIDHSGLWRLSQLLVISTTSVVSIGLRKRLQLLNKCKSLQESL